MHRAEVTDAKTGKLSFNRAMTKTLLSAMFDEVLALFPEIDGFQVRVGEVYLQDAPFHTGSGAVDYHLPFPEQQAECKRPSILPGHRVPPLPTEVLRGCEDNQRDRMVGGDHGVLCGSHTCRQRAGM